MFETLVDFLKTNIDELDPLAGLIEEDDASNEFDLWSDSLQLIEDGRFAEASEKLRYLILSFPEGNFIGDALFWLGEIYFLQENYIDSSDSFNELISTYEKHNRIPDANFKLGMISLRSEDSNKAKEYFNYLINNYPDSGAGILAAEELKKFQ